LRRPRKPGVDPINKIVSGPVTHPLEDLILRASRHIDKSLIAGLSTCDWVRKQQNIIIMGATGTGKSWLSSAFGTQACRQSLSVLCRRTVSLYDDITQAMADGSLPKLKARLIRPKVLMLDDIGMGISRRP
jgi:DNA replication protein DnaC